jgi:hypothetical protein
MHAVAAACRGGDNPGITPAAVPSYALVVMATLLDFSPGELAVI